MFNCYLHSWSHIERPCPLCFGFTTATSYAITLPPIRSTTHKCLQPEEFDRLKQERDEYREALEQIEKHRHTVESQSTGMRQYFDTESSLLAREVMEKWKK